MQMNLSRKQSRPSDDVHHATLSRLTLQELRPRPELVANLCQVVEDVPLIVNVEAHVHHLSAILDNLHPRIVAATEANGAEGSFRREGVVHVVELRMPKNLEAQGCQRAGRCTARGASQTCLYTRLHRMTGDV